MKSDHLHKRRTKRVYAIVFTVITLVIITISTLNFREYEREELGVEQTVAIEQISAKEIPLYGLLEIDLNVTASFQNPFDPEENDVTAVITTASGKVIELPVFYYQDFSRELADGIEKLTELGEAYWKVRFTPTEIGVHTLYVTLKDEGETTNSENLTFNVHPSSKLGFAGLSGKDEHYLQFSNNKSFFLIGHDVCWFGSRGTYDYDEWFSSMNLNGENITRIWMAPWAFGIEWKELGYYDLTEAWRLDYVLKKAEEKGIYVILCLMNHGQLQSSGLTGQWNDNPYNEGKGGPLGRPDDFWNNKEAIDLFKRRLRYIVARWGYSTHVLAWEFWNEVELTDNYDFDLVARWHNEMAEYLRETDPYEHLITTSSDPRLGGLDSMSFVTVHRYGPESFKDIASGLSEIIKDLSARYEKPILITEFGADWRWFDSPYFYEDREGVEIHNGIWSSILSGSASCAMLWWWDNYIHPYDLYYHFGALSRYLGGIDPVEAGFWELQVRLVSPDQISRDDLTDLTVFPRLGWAKPEANLFKVDLNGEISNVSQFSYFIHGSGHPELGNNPTFVVTFPYGGEVVVHVNSVATSGAVLEIYRNNSLVESVLLADRDGKNAASVDEYNMLVKTSVPPGTHEIRLDNSGGDWLSIDYVIFTYAMLNMAKTRVIGLGNGTLAIVWIQNSDHTWWNVVNEVPIEPIKDATIEFSGFSDGEYVVEWWDTYDGEILERQVVMVSGGKLPIIIRNLKRDIALKIHSAH